MLPEDKEFLLITISLQGTISETWWKSGFKKVAQSLKSYLSMFIPFILAIDSANPLNFVLNHITGRDFILRGAPFLSGSIQLMNIAHLLQKYIILKITSAVIYSKI